MNERLLDILKPQGHCISEEMLISYAKGTLAADEARRVEEHLTECEFCSDALDGIMKSGDLQHYYAKVSSTKRSLHRKLRSVEEKSTFPFTRALAIAATVLLLVVSAWFVQYLMNNESQKIFSDQFKPYPADSLVQKPMQPSISEAAPQLKSVDSAITPKKNKPIPENKKNETQNSVADRKVENQVVNENAPEIEEPLTVTSSQNAQADEEKVGADKDVTLPQESRGAVSNFSVEPKSGYAQNNDAVETIALSKKEETDQFITDHLNRGVDFYQGEKYAESVSEFQLVLKEDPLNATANFYSGVSSLVLNNPDEALNYFKKTDNKSNRFYEATLWYEALAYLKKDDKKEAKKLLEKVVGMNGEYKTQAEETLKEL